MTNYEKLLYSKIQNNNSYEPLKNVREGLGAIRHYKGNPLSKTEISIQVTIQFSNSFIGVPIAPAALAIGNQTSLPVHLFGLTDFYGGFLKSSTINSPPNPWVFIFGASGIIGYQAFAFGGLPLMVQPVQGDLVLSYQAPDGAGGVDGAWITVHCNNVAYGTFLNSFVSDLITIDLLRYLVPIANVNQFQNSLIFGVQSLFGKTRTDTIDPRVYITNKDFQAQISDIPLHLPIDKTLMLSFQMDVFCPMLSFILFVEKIEALTIRK